MAQHGGCSVQMSVFWLQYMQLGFPVGVRQGSIGGVVLESSALMLNTGVLSGLTPTILAGVQPLE